MADEVLSKDAEGKFTWTASANRQVTSITKTTRTLVTSTDKNGVVTQVVNEVVEVSTPDQTKVIETKTDEAGVVHQTQVTKVR